MQAREGGFMLEIRAVGYRYGKKAPDLFSALDLHLEPGKIYGLLGRNGAGKTTLLKLAAGLLFSRTGEVTFEGKSVASRRPEVLADLFFLPETFSLPPLKAGDYEKAASPFYPRFESTVFQNALEEFQIELHKPLNRLSYGQQKKFLLAFGLACGCRLNLLDEPTNGLDIPSKSQFRRLLARQLTDERTFVLSTHQARDLDGLIDPVVIVDAGRVVFHHDRFSIDRGLVQASTRTEPGPEVLRAEKAWDTWVTLGPRSPTEGPGGPAVDLELLFNAVLARPEAVRAALEVSHV
jgi:ABC-2 type transport system ATP-binding protein